MEVKRTVKNAFAVIGKEGSTKDGVGFIQALWDRANSGFYEIAHLAKKTDDGALTGIWGAMSDFSRSYLPWKDNFTKGLYLAGVECEIDVEAPLGWTKWVIPTYEYVVTENLGNDTFSKVLSYLQEENMSLVGAVHEYISPQNEKTYFYFPIRKL